MMGAWASLFGFTAGTQPTVLLHCAAAEVISGLACASKYISSCIVHVFMIGPQQRPEGRWEVAPLCLLRWLALVESAQGSASSCSLEANSQPPPSFLASRARGSDANCVHRPLLILRALLSVFIMAPIFTHAIALPPYVLALFLVVLFSLLACTAAWVFLVRRRRFNLRIPTTQVEAQVQVQVQVEKIHDAPPARSSSWLMLPFATSTGTSSPSDRWIQRILRGHSKEAAPVIPPGPPAAERRAPTPPLDGSQPPRPVRKEMWFAFESDATLATLHGDPLGGLYRKAYCRDPVSTSAVSTPSLVDDKSTPPSPTSFWEPLTPPLFPEDYMRGQVPSLCAEDLTTVAFKKSEETDHACPCPCRAPEETRLSLPSASSSVCTLIQDTPSLPAPGGISPAEHELDSDTDLKVSCKRLAALIDAISVSFSVSTLGPPFSRRTTKIGLGDCDYDSDDDSDDDSIDGDDCDLPHCADDDGREWDLGTVTLHDNYPQRDYPILAI